MPPLVDHFNRVMSSIGTPMRLMFPILDTILSRRTVIDDLNALNARYDNLLTEKRSNLGKDILSYLLEDTHLTQEELRSNLATLFSAGHDTTSGALAIGWQPVRGTCREPTYANLKCLPPLDAVIHESLRINPPVALLPARMSDEDVVVLGTHLPCRIPLVPNIYAAHHTAGAYMPFGIGPRQPCPAQHFALFEQRTLLGHKI
ncbi:cytochrome P450 [Mycena amicta]|nr:cytochrome P450 [Mycena amicta]